MNINIFDNIISIPNNIYSIQLKKSYDWFDKVYMKQPTEKDWIELFGKKRGKTIADIELLNLTDARSTAIILLGLSSCGKTTFALDFVKYYLNFTYCSYDAVGLEVMSEYVRKGFLPQESVIDSYTIYEFGEVLKGHKKSKNNIIIDGSWVAPNSRGALINTLRILGYKNLIIFSFLKMPEEEVNVRLTSRAVRQVIQSEKIRNSQDSITLANTISQFATLGFKEIVESSGKSVDEIIHTKEFVKEFNELANNYFRLEPFNSSLPVQINYNIFNYGIDYFVDLY